MTTTMEQPIQKRSVAIKVPIGAILALPFVKGEGWNSSFLQGTDLQVSRVNVLATIIQKQSGTMLDVEDHSGQIQLRIFEDKGLFSEIEIGNVVQIIGRPREYNGERYLLPEIVKKIDAAWLKVRSKELALSPIEIPNDSMQQQSSRNEDTGANEDAFIQEVEVEEIQPENPIEKICNYIKTNDAGHGVDVQDIVESRVVENVENYITTLLKNGDIFEIKPGRVKVLE